MDEPVGIDGIAPRPEPRPAGSMVPGRRVLVVDDNDASAQSLALILHLEGYEVRTAHDGEMALAILPAFRPEAVLSDIGLPGIDGHELARRIRRDRELSGDLRLLAALTGYSGPEARRRSLEAGFDRHLVKPIDPEMVLALLASLEWRQGPMALGIAPRRADTAHREPSSPTADSERTWRRGS